MPTPLHIKGTKTRVLNSFPSSNVGQDGDMVISRIKNKGVYLCTKAGGIWYVANQLQELRKVDKASIRDLTTKKLKISKINNALKNTDAFIVSDNGQIKYRTGNEVVDDLDISVKDIGYKQAYCSLGQYTNKEDCEANNGTWYYSDNASYDSISNTAENELLTVASSLGKLDAEPTLLYDGSTLEIKRNTDYDDNWQTSAQDSLLKLSYDSSNYATFTLTDTGDLTIATVGDGTYESDMTLDVKGDLYMTARNNVSIEAEDVEIAIGGIAAQQPAFTLKSYATSFGIASGPLLNLTNQNGDPAADAADGQIVGQIRFNSYDDGTPSTQVYGQILCTTVDVSSGAEQGSITLKTAANDGSSTSGLLLTGNASAAQVDATFTGDITMTSVANTNDYFNITVGAEGATTLSTVDADTAVGHLTLDADGDIKLDAAGSDIVIDNAGTTFGKFNTGTGGKLKLIGTTNYNMEIVSFGTGDILLTSADNITIDAADTLTIDTDGTFIMKKDGTEFSAANSAYAGMILGYSVFRNLTGSPGNEIVTITTSMTVLETVQGNKLNVSFVAPPSGKVEIVLSALFTASSRSVAFSLSDNATYNEVNAIHTYDGASIKPDETDYTSIYVPFVVEGLTAGTSYQYWIAGASSSSTVKMYHGVDRTGAPHSQPIAIKATALPATIVNEE